MPEYELTESKKAVLLKGLDIVIKQTQAAPDSFSKGVVLADMFETKDILKHNRLTYRD